MRAIDRVIERARRDAAASGVRQRFADVTAIGTTTVTVHLDGADIEVPRNLTAYPTPSVGDRAHLLVDGATVVAIGRTA